MAVAIGTTILSAVGLESAAGAIVVGSITVAGVVGTVVSIGATYALQSLLAPGAISPGITPTQVAQKQAAQQFTTRQAVPSRRKYYGRNKAAGYYGFLQSLNGSLYQVILIAHGEVSFVEHWIGDRKVTLDGSGNVTSPATMVAPGPTYIFVIDPAAGTLTQAAHAALLANFSSKWDASHTLTGIANVMFLQKGVPTNQFTTYYPGGAQNYRAVFDAARVYNVLDSAQDPGNPSTWDLGYSNAACVIRDYLTSPDGMAIPQSAINVDDFAAAASACNDIVTHADLTTDQRYRIAGGYDLDVAPKEQLAKLLSACDGFLRMKGDGTLGLDVGKWSEPTVVIDDAHIRAFDLPKGLGPLRMANEVRATYVDPNLDYQAVEAQPWRDDDDISNRGQVLSQTMDLTYVPSHNQARRLMKIAAARANPTRSGTITTDFYGLNALGERRLRLIIAARGIDMTVEVTSLKIDMETASCVIGVTAMPSSAYDFDAATEEGSVPNPSSISGAGTIESPSGFSATAVGSTFDVSCAAPSDRSDLQLHVEVSVQSSGVWTAVPVAVGAFSGTSAVLAAATYDLRAWFTAPGGAMSDYATLTGKVLGAVGAPSVPTNLAAVNSSGTVTVSWKAPNDSKVDSCHVYRNSTNTFGTATDITGPVYCSPNQALSMTDTPGAGTWYYWATSVSPTGATSGSAGSVNVTV